MRSDPEPTDDALPDAGLIRGAQQGDEAACSELVARHLAPVRAFVAMRLPISHVVDEITHETFVFAFTHLADFELRESFRAWLRSIAFNLVRRELLRFAREQQNLTNFERLQLKQLEADAERAGLRDEAVFLEECMGRLPERMRELLEDRYHRGLTGGQIAERLGRTEEWVRVTLLRVRRLLRECIATPFECGGGPGGNHATTGSSHRAWCPSGRRDGGAELERGRLCHDLPREARHQQGRFLHTVGSGNHRGQ